MAEAHDENSINTDLTFESGDENVRIPRNLNKQLVTLLPIEIVELKIIWWKQLFQHQIPITNFVHSFLSSSTHSIK